jgi:hypothetical protein
LFFALYKGLHRLFYWGIFWPVAKHQKRCLESPCGCFIPWMGAPAGRSWERIPQASRGVWRPKNMNAKQIQFVDKRDGLTWTVTICIYLLVANGRFTTLARSQSGSAVIVQNNWDVAQKMGWIGMLIPRTKQQSWDRSQIEVFMVKPETCNVICVLCLHPCFLGHAPPSWPCAGKPYVCLFNPYF